MNPRTNLKQRVYSRGMAIMRRIVCALAVQPRVPMSEFRLSSSAIIAFMLAALNLWCAFSLHKSEFYITPWGFSSPEIHQKVAFCADSILMGLCGIGYLAQIAKAKF